MIRVNITLAGYSGLLQRIAWLKDTMPKTEDDLTRWSIFPVYPGDDCITVEFMREEDAVLFILRWQK